MKCILNPNTPISSPEFLDREYNPRLRVADYANYVSRWKMTSAETRRAFEAQLDISYGESVAETLDFFAARKTNSAQAPLLVFIHGGYWRALDKSDFSWIAAPFVDSGIAVAIVNYGLAPLIPISEIVQQIRRSCLWLYRNARELNVDPLRFVCAGHSAGGHLCGMMLATDWPSLSTGTPQNLFSGAVAVSGLFDLLPLSQAPFLQEDIKLDELSARQLSPAFLTQHNQARILLAVGEAESTEFHRQTGLLAMRWNGTESIRQLLVPNCNHFSVCDAFASPGNVLFERTLKTLLWTS